MAPEVLLAKLQDAARNPGGNCRLADEQDNAKRVKRLLQATVADLLSIRTPVCGRAGRGWGSFNAVMAVSDIALVKTAGTIVVKGAVKGGSHTWKATRAWLGRTGFAEKWQHVHHAIVSQQYFRGTKWEAIFNQPWNLKALEPPPGVTMDTWHKMIEGKLPGLNMAERWWYGMPDWFHYAEISAVGDTVTAIENE